MRLQFTKDSRDGTHAQLGAVKYRVRELSVWPDRQVGQTIGVMRERVSEDAQTPEFQQWAWQVCGEGDDVERVGRAFEHVKGVVSFQRDETSAAQLEGEGVDAGDVVEVIIRPLDMKRYVERGVAMGDCDDFSMYLAALLEACNIACSFVTVAADAQAPYQFSHVYVAAYPVVDGVKVRVPLDASHGPMPGWEAEQVVEVQRKQEWSVGNAFGWLMEAVGFGVVGLLVWKAAGMGQER